MTKLMHPLEARNHANSGFFPTDLGTVGTILNRIVPTDHAVTLLDPCCGAGEALAQFRSILPSAKLVGIEMNRTRYNQANQALDHAYCANIEDVKLGRADYDAIFLNPPYGRAFSDKESDDKVERLEHQFLTKVFPSLKANGLLIYIVPKTSFDEKRQKWLLSHFKQISLFEADVDTYKQVVFMGIKLKYPQATPAEALEKFANKLNQLKPLAELPCDNLYELPENKGTHHPKIEITRLDEEAISVLLRETNGQWGQFQWLFSESTEQFCRPIHALSDWHLALMITSGAITGIVENEDKTKKLLVKGVTKKRRITKEAPQDEDDESQIIVTRDRFQAEINAIDLTEGPTFGQIMTIR